MGEDRVLGWADVESDCIILVESAVGVCHRGLRRQLFSSHGVEGREWLPEACVGVVLEC